MLRLWYLVRELVSAGPARSTTHNVTQDEHYTNSVHVPYLFYPLMYVFRVQSMVFQTGWGLDQL